MLVSATEMLKKQKQAIMQLVSLISITWSGQSPSFSPLKNFVPLLFWVYPRVPASTWAVMM